jgi:hypothetical protein
MCRPLVAVFFGLGVLLLGSPAFAQTPDSFTPAVEEACTKYEGEGARQGLCIAYCEAQDCDNTKDSNPSCGTIEERFIAYSVRQGYVKGPKDKPVISCKVTACSKDDIGFCGGREQDCSVGGMCTQICTATFEGFNSDNKPLCSVAPPCKKCTAEIPPKP